MIPDQFLPGGSAQAEAQLLLPILGLPSEVETSLCHALLEPAAISPSGGGAKAAGHRVKPAEIRVSPSGSGANLARNRAELAEGWWLERHAAGGAALFQQAPGGPVRRWAIADGAGRLHGLLRWEAEAGVLGGMALRLPGGAWMEVHPRSAEHPLWGASDLLLLRDGGAPQPLASFQAVNYGAISHIPPLDLPGALPPGAGEALLNTLAMLLHDQGSRDLHYQGPYPTEHLFHSLLRSFHCLQPEQEGLSAFACNEFKLAATGDMAENSVRWRPAPFAPTMLEKNLLVVVRDGVEAVWLGKFPYRRANPVSGRLPGGARVWQEKSGQDQVYRVGLILLGAPYKIYCTLDAKGGLLEIRKQEDAGETENEVRPARPLWREAVAAWAAFNSAPALAPSIIALAPRLSLAWADLPHGLASMQELQLLLQAGAFTQFHRLRNGQQDSALGMMLISDLLSGAMPLLRRRAQADLAAAETPEPAALDQLGESTRQAAGERLKKVVPALLQSLLLEGGVDHGA